MERRQIEQIVSSRGWLETQPEEVRSTILRASQLRHYDSGDTIYRLDDSPGGVFGVGHGSCRFWFKLPSGQRRFGGFIYPGMWFGTRTYFKRGPRLGEFRAARPTWMFHLPMNALNKITPADDRIYHALGFLSEMNIIWSLRLASDLLIRSAERRIAASLLRSVGVESESSVPIFTSMPMTQNEIAEMSNASRFSVNRSLACFAERGWIRTGYNQVELIDLQALYKCAYAEEGAEVV